MSNELDVAVDGGKLPAKGNTFSFNQAGAGTNIGVAQNVDNSTINIYLPGGNNAPQPGGTYTRRTINCDYYNLFVILGETFSSPYFMVDVTRALTVREGTSQRIHDRLSVFDDAAKDEIMSYPAIFATENYRYSPPEFPTDGPQMAFYGFITGIRQMHDGSLKIYFQKLDMCPIPQDLLNQMLAELDLWGKNSLNELDRTHWAIKNVNLIEEMKLKGISLLVPSI